MPSIVIPDRPGLGLRSSVPSRPAEDDEHYVLWRYASHATRCSLCEHPLETLRQREGLCPRGVLHARTVKNYVYSKNGKLYSGVDRDMGREVQLQVPPACGVIRELMLAMERGLTVDSPKPAHADVVVREKNTDVQKYSNQRERYYDYYDSYGSQLTPAHHNKKRSFVESDYTPRGTLYDTDMTEKRTSHEPVRKPQRRITWAV